MTGAASLPNQLTGQSGAVSFACGAERRSSDCLKILAETEDGEVMAMKHREHPVVGLQFHPESIYTEHGKRLIENFVNGVI